MAKALRTALVKEYDEPEVGSTLDRQAYHYACEYYRLNIDYDKSIEYIRTWAKKNNQNIIDVDKLKKYSVKSTVPWIARLKTRNITLPQETEEFFAREIKSLEMQIVALKDQISSVKTPLLVEVKALKKDDVAMCDLEEAEDKLLLKKEFDIQELFRTVGRSPIKLAKIQKKYAQRLEQLESIKSDSALKEAYKTFDKDMLKTLIAFYNDIISYCKSTADNVRRLNKQKPRAKKKVPVDKIVKDVKYMRHAKDLNITSLPASKVVGATMLAVYDVQGRYLRIYEAADKESLSFKGTSLINSDETKCRVKKIRKPEKQIPNFLTGTKKSFIKSFNEINGTESKASIRMNDNLLFLRIF